jgi:hypothetical protein
MSLPVTKKDLAAVDHDLEAELDCMPLPELRRLAKLALRNLYYDRVRCAKYYHETIEKRKEYYHTMVKPKRAKAKLEARLRAALAPDS